MVKKHLRNNTPSIYQIGEKALTRKSTKGGSKRNDVKSFEAEILLRNLKEVKFKIIPPEKVLHCIKNEKHSF